MADPVESHPAAPPIAPAMPAMPVQCPICGRKPRRFKPLYDVPVCKKCRNALANRRQLACLLDYILLALVAWFGIRFMVMVAGPGNPVYLVFGISFLIWTLYALKDGFNGRSPGRWLMGLQVVDRTTREPIGFWQSFKRNLIFLPAGILGIVFFAGLLQLLVVIVVCGTMLKGRRWGEGWANTEVIWLKHRNRPPFEPRPNFCRSCGYDLTGNVSGRCPECGWDIPEQVRGILEIGAMSH